MEFLYSFSETMGPFFLIMVGGYLLQTRVLDRRTSRARQGPTVQPPDEN